MCVVPSTQDPEKGGIEIPERGGREENKGRKNEWIEKSAHRRGIKGRGHKRKKARKLRLTCLQSKDKSSLGKGFKKVSRARDKYHSCLGGIY